MNRCALVTPATEQLFRAAMFLVENEDRSSTKDWPHGVYLRTFRPVFWEITEIIKALRRKINRAGLPREKLLDGKDGTGQ